MKLCIITPTFNRAQNLQKLYNSIKNNKIAELEIEWIIIDDGSRDNTKEVIDKFIEEKEIEIKYFFQENQGKMVALNNAINYAKGEFIVECDSDDFFSENAFKSIYENVKIKSDVYAYAFLKYDQNGCNIGKQFKENAKKTTMFDLYFKEGENGEKALVFNAEIRKKFRHELEEGEKFITEARMYHKMDEKYNIIGINLPIMICEYRKDGYTKNIKQTFLSNPKGYYKYFKEILQMPMKGVLLRKRIYAYKHYILFSYLTKQKGAIKSIPRITDKIYVILLWIPGIIKFELMF